MRTQKDILGDLNFFRSDDTEEFKHTQIGYVQLEVLLDIRDLLVEKSKPIIQTQNIIQSRQAVAQAVCPHEWVEEYETKTVTCDHCGILKSDVIKK